MTSTQNWYHDNYNRQSSTTSRPGTNNNGKSFNQNIHNDFGSTTLRTYNINDQRQTNYDDKIVYDNSDRDSYNRQPSRDRNTAFVGDNHSDSVNLRPYEQRLPTTTTKSTRSTSYPSYTTKQSYFPGDLPFLNTDSTVSLYSHIYFLNSNS